MTSLLDSFNRIHNYLRISVTDRCNFRCSYCLPAISDSKKQAGMQANGIDLKPRQEILTFDEIYRVAKILSELGVNKVRLTGGEPLARKDVEALIIRISSLYNIKTIGMTTNGYYLAEKVELLKNSGLTHLNISLDTLNPSRFKEITLRDGLDKVMKGIYSAIDAGFDALKLNVVVIRGFNDDEILNFVDFVQDKPIQVRFIEYMPFKNNSWREDGFVPYDEIKNNISDKYDLITSDGGKVSKDFSIDGFVGSVGFITSISNHFCGTCNRLRMTADGHLKTCLFSNDEVSIMALLRNGASDDEIKSLILDTLKQKNEMHDGIAGLLKSENRSMLQIGG
ncbi:MAG: GTP 3',8-cyclase MoaA [Bacteroidetes bacterium]|nr:GTP 3',8-cyclase MoaA [Bacteroidota bacterium]MBU1422655.1 GTP 3',8-cyclase MoaA [Bacteroidota bacterium]